MSPRLTSRLRPLLAAALAAAAWSATAAPAQVVTQPPWVLDGARADATAKLAETLATTPVAPDVTAGQLARALQVSESFLALAQGAQQVGAARHLGGGAVEVRLQLDGNRPASLLAAAYAPGLTVVSRPQLDLALERWVRTSFVATGSAMPPELVLSIELRQGVWRSVGREARQAVAAEALAAARADGQTRLLALQLADGQTLGQVLPAGQVQQHVRPVLEAAPVTRLGVGGEGELTVRLYLPPEALADAVLTALAGGTQVQRGDLVERIRLIATAATGRAQLPIGGEAQLMATGLEDLPTLPPAWAEQALTARGTALLPSDSTQTTLQAARRAEQEALAELRQKVLDLPLSRGQRIGDSERRTMSRAVDAALAAARRSDTRIGEGSVEVEVTLDGSTLWSELRKGR